MSVKIDIEVKVKLDYGQDGETLTLTKDDAMALRDALNEAFPVKPAPLNHWAPGVRTPGIQGPNRCRVHARNPGRHK